MKRLLLAILLFGCAPEFDQAELERQITESINRPFDNELCTVEDVQHMGGKIYIARGFCSTRELGSEMFTVRVIQMEHGLVWEHM